jgi:hypothetical protein
MVSQLKTPRLSEIDLARIAPMNPMAREQALRSLGARGFPYYKGVLLSLADTFNVEMNARFSTQPSSWPQVENFIRHNCAQKEAIIESNVEIGRALFEWGAKHEITGVRNSFRPMALSPSAGTVAYWHDIILRIDGKLFVPFIDPRKANCLTPEGRRFVFSLQHTHIHENPDFANIGFVIFQFTNPKIGNREAISHFSDGCEFLDFKTLQSMVHETYSQFAAVIAARAVRDATGTDG